MRYNLRLQASLKASRTPKLIWKPFTTSSNMSSNTASDQGQNAATKEVEQSTAETVSGDNTSKIDNQGDAGASKEQDQQTGPGPKVLRSHFRGMPRQWEKNQPPKKDEE